MPETRKWLSPWGMEDNNDASDPEDPEPPEPASEADNKASTKKPPQYTMESAEIIIPDEGLKEGQPYKFKGKVRRLDGVAPSNASISVQSVYRYNNEEQICGNPEFVEINKDTLEFTGEFDELFEPNAYYLDKNKTPDSKFILILKLRGGCLDKDSFSSEVKLPMVTKDYILKKACYDETWADAKKDDASYPKSGDNYFPKDTVKKVQSLLIKTGFLNTGNDTGFYGDLTEAAIHDFQLVSKGQKRSKTKEGKIFFIGMNEITFKGADDGIYGPETEKEIAHWIQNNYTKPLERFVKGDIDQNGVRNGHGEREKENYHEQEQLTEAQDLFTQIGAYAGKRDGWFWDKMEAAIKWFQECAEKGEFVDAEGKKVVLDAKKWLKDHRPSPSVLDWVKIEYAKMIKGKGLKLPKQPIQKGIKGTIAEEINIRLAGFGGGVPSDVFDDATEKKVKQFQADYMKMKSPTGIVDEETAKAIDLFSAKYPVDFNKLKCKCGVCTGFGKGQYKGKYSNTIENEAYNKYEYPGVHRSLLWAIRALMFYLESVSNPHLKVGNFFSVYRCWEDNNKHSRSSTNHMGKAADLHIDTKTGGKDWFRPEQDSENTKLCNKVREICISKMAAQLKWDSENRFSLEPSTGDVKADVWVHIDLRTFDHSKYLQDNFFVKDEKGLNGKNITSF